jgi:hypothetical protein
MYVKKAVLSLGLFVACYATGQQLPTRPSAEPRPPQITIAPDARVVMTRRFEPTIRNQQEFPPKVASMAAKPLPNGSALIMVRFEPGQKLPSTINLSLETGSTLLRDDGQGGDERAGDGIYSATVQVDHATLQKFRLSSATQEVQSFKGRTTARLKVGVLPERFQRPDVILLPHLPIPIPVPPPDPMKALMITDLGVIEDPGRTFNSCTNQGTPMGKWTFGYLMQQMANQPVSGISPSDFVMRWLTRWEFDQAVNDWTVGKRPNIKTLIIDPWVAASGGPGNPLDLSKAPFRLLAIVNRVDLRGNLLYGGGGSDNGGEARFVFGALGPGCQALRFTVIFEYGIRKNSCSAEKQWANQWMALNGLVPGTPAYNTKLEQITEQFAKANADPLKPNHSALNQLRTNEIALSSPWQLREFHVAAGDSDAGHLREVTVKQTPDITLNQTATLTDYVNANAAAIIAQEHDVPLDFPGIGSPFLGGAANVPTPAFFWNNGASPTITDREARHMFSLQTCNGCHGGETHTIFLQIAPTPFGTPPALAGFLTGIDVVDPADGSPTRHFADLQRRADDLSSLVSKPCILQLPFLPTRMTH